MWIVHALILFAVYGFGNLCCNIWSFFKPICNGIITAFLVVVLLLAAHTWIRGDETSEGIDLPEVAEYLERIFENHLQPLISAVCKSVDFCSPSILRLLGLRLD